MLGLVSDFSSRMTQSAVGQELQDVIERQAPARKNKTAGNHYRAPIEAHKTVNFYSTSLQIYLGLPEYALHWWQYAGKTIRIYGILSYYLLARQVHVEKVLVEMTLR